MAVNPTNSSTSTLLQSLSNWSMASTTSGSSAQPMNLTGLASGVDTNTIVQELMSIEQQPLQRLQLQQSRDQATASALNDVQTQLLNLQTAEQALQSPALWAPTQTASSTDSSKVTATMTSGAGPGGYQVAVSRLAMSWQHSFTYTPPTQDDTITIGTTAVSIAAGSDVNTAAADINSANGSPVFAAVVTDNSGNQTLVLSSRQTGQANNFTATGGTLSNDTTIVQGQDAAYSINNGATQTSASNVVGNAIPGVQLTLSAIVPATSPVTVNVSSPAPNESAIQDAMQSYVTAYNQTIGDISSKLTEAPVAKPQNATDAAKGVLYGDMGLSSLLDQLRESFSSLIAPSNPTGFQTMGDIGLSTGAAVGSGALNQNSIQGQITFDTAKFASAFATNPTAVQTLIGGSFGGAGFVQSVDALLAPQVGVGGVLSLRISDEGQAQSELSSQIADMQQRLNQKQTLLQKQFAAMESAMQSSQAQGQWLTGQLSGLPTASATGH